MSDTGERFLVTGALGCIGAWTVRALVRRGLPVVAFDVGRDPRRLRLILSPEEMTRVELVAGDITDLDALSTALERSAITNVIHLAALQVPFCKADPPAGARVNVLGTIHVFEAVKRRREMTEMAPVVYASSIGMYALDDAGPGSGRLRSDADAHPRNHYGVFKLANEGSARVYWLDDGIPSIGLRPMTVYGPGRDQGMTSGPTKAIVAAVLGRPYTMPFRGPVLYQYAEDAAETLVAASRSAGTGAEVYNLAGPSADERGLVEAIETVIPGARELLRFDDAVLPFPTEIDHDGLEGIGPILSRPLADGIRASVDIYRPLAEAGRLDPVEQGLVPRQA